MKAKIPAWLSKSQSNVSHFDAALTILSERETARVHIRSTSRPENDSSRPGRRARFVRRQEPQLPSGLVEHYSVAVGSHHEYRDRNRYADVEPYDRTRVVVGEDTNQSRSATTAGAHDAEALGRYLNASWVLEKFGGKWWIATQAPLPHTAHAFISLISQAESRPHSSISSSPPSPRPKFGRIRTVVQLTRNIESGRRKAHDYFPSVPGQSIILAPESGHSAPLLKVSLLESFTMEESQCIVSNISIVTATASGEETGQPITFRHLLYHSWPDQGVPKPEDRAALLSFIQLVDRTNRDISLTSDPNDPSLDPDPPIIVGCSAGIGRTGSFIALSSLLRKHGILPAPSSPAPSTSLPPSPLGPLPNDFQDDLVAQEVDSLREQRPGMVQRDEQILLIYEMLAAAFS